MLSLGLGHRNTGSDTLGRPSACRTGNDGKRAGMMAFKLGRNPPFGPHLESFQHGYFIGRNLAHHYSIICSEPAGKVLHAPSNSNPAYIVGKSRAIRSSARDVPDLLENAYVFRVR